MSSVCLTFHVAWQAPVTVLPRCWARPHPATEVEGPVEPASPEAQLNCSG